MTIYRFNSIGERIIVEKDGNIHNVEMENHHEWLPKFLIHDQEPLYYFGQKKNWLRLWNSYNRLDNRAIILTSELNSPELDKFCEFTGAEPCHWFSNGVLSLEWYDDLKMSLNDNLSNDLRYKFSCLNRLISDQRRYRPVIAAFLMQNVKNDWLQLSCNVIDPISNMHACDAEEIPDHHRTLLSKLREKERPIKINTLTSESKLGEIENNSFNPSSYYFDHTFCHIVTETLFYESTLHLTEKSLRPIVNRRPFILVGPPRSLEYLRRYGFKTFSAFWNEDYDSIDDPNDRLDAIMNLINELNQMKLPDMKKMLANMREVLQHNYDHFYGDFWKVVRQELIDNLEQSVSKLKTKFNPNLTYLGIASMSDEEFERYIIKKEYADDDAPLITIMSRADKDALKRRAALLYYEWIDSETVNIKKNAGKDQFLASLRSLMNK